MFLAQHVSAGDMTKKQTFFPRSPASQMSGCAARFDPLSHASRRGLKNSAPQERGWILMPHSTRLSASEVAGLLEVQLLLKGVPLTGVACSSGALASTPMAFLKRVRKFS